MKKLVALILTMLFVMGLAAYAAAEVSISGDGRVRGVYTNNKTDMDDAVQDHERYIDQRIRLNIDGKNDDDAAVKMQVTVAEGKHDGGANTKDTTRASDTFGLTRDENYAYVMVPFGDIKVEAGLMPADWGNKLMAWGASRERIKVYTKMGDTTVGAFSQMDNDAATTIGTEDKTSYAAYAVAPMGDLKAGAIVIYTKDDAKQDDDTGQIVDAFVSGKMGDMSLAGELFYKGGALNEADKNADGKTDDARIAAFVQVGMAMDSLNLTAAVAMSQNDGETNKYFTPTALFGESQPTAVDNFGDDYDTTAVVVGVSTKVGDAMTVGVKGAYAKADAYYDADKGSDWTIMEVDGTFKYTVGDNTYYEAVVAYGKPDSDVAGAANDNIIAAMHGLYINF